MADLADLSKKPKASKRAAFKPKASTPDPLADVEYSDPPNLEADTAAEFDALQAGFKARAKQEARRFQDVTDSEFWVAVCFQTRAEKEAFLKALNLAQLGDKYIDGHKAAQLLGVDLKPNS